MTVTVDVAVTVGALVEGGGDEEGSAEALRSGMLMAMPTAPTAAIETR